MSRTKEMNVTDLKGLLDSCNDEGRKRMFEKFIQSHIIRGLSPASVSNYIQSMVFWNRVITKDFNAFTEDDVNDAFMFLEGYTFTGKDGKVREYSQVSKNTRKIHLRAFFNFIGRDDLTKNIKVRKIKNSKLPEDLLTRDEVHQMIDASQNLRDRALVSLLYESGARSGEILSLKIKNLERHEKGYYVHFPQGKTGARKILVIYSAKYLFNWLQSHPLKGDREAPLWVHVNGEPKALAHGAMHTRLYAIARRAGIKKKVNPHSFRHAQATELAKDFTEQQMKRYLGWTAGSDMASVYVHLSGRDIDDAILKKNGIEIEERKTSLKPNECPKCHFISEGNINYCSVCGMLLKVEYEKTTEKTVSELVELLKQNPDVLLDALSKIQSM